MNKNQLYKGCDFISNTDACFTFNDTLLELNIFLRNLPPKARENRAMLLQNIFNTQAVAFSSRISVLI